MTFKLGIIAGSGDLPSEIAEAHQSKGGKCYIAGLKNFVELEKLNTKNYASFEITKVGAILQFFKDNKVNKIVFAGKVNRPNLTTLKVDLVGATLFARILKAKISGDDSLLQIITKFVEEKGYEVISAKNILNGQGSFCLAKINQKPQKQDLIDIELGVKVCESLGDLDIGQAVIVQNGYVIGIEAAEGTDNLIKRSAELRKTSGGVLIKMMKSTQDKRLDIPTIGPETIKLLSLYDYNGIAIESQVIIVELLETIKLANLHKIFMARIENRTQS